MDWNKWRAFRFHRQGLDGSQNFNDVASVYRCTGWARSIGGHNPYLAVFARSKFTAADVDAAVADMSAHELPSLRGCAYVMGSSDYSLGLHLSQKASLVPVGMATRHFGFTDAERIKLENAVVKSLESGPLDVRAIREACGDTVRHLGDEGKKRGMTSTLQLATGPLQSAGVIRRIPLDGKLDNERYAYALWPSNPVKDKPYTPEEAKAEMLECYALWNSPAIQKSFQGWSSIGVKETSALLAAGTFNQMDEGTWAHADLVDAWESFEVPSEPQYALVSSLDNISHFMWGPELLVDEQDRNIEVMTEKGIRVMGGLSDFNTNLIFDRGRLIGLWDYCPDNKVIEYFTWVKPTKELNQKVEKLQSRIVRELGDVRTFSLDSVKSRQPRLQWLRDQRNGPFKW